ncbi:MAG: FAD-dependent oxidoreductase [Halobacteriota archaeon]
MRIVVLGGGFAGLEFVESARRLLPGAEITMIDKRDKLQYLPSNPEILSGKVMPDEISGDLRKFAEKHGANFVREEVTSVDFASKLVKTTGREIPFDFCVVTIGAEQSYFGIPGAQEHSHSVYSLEDTVKAKVALDRLPKTVAVVGAGLTGVEVVGELLDFFKDKGVDGKVYLVEALQNVLPGFRDKVSNYVHELLNNRGVEILLNKIVKEVKDGVLSFADGSKLDCEMLIWTAGVKTGTLSEKLDLPKDRRGWIETETSLLVKGKNDVAAIGDVTSVSFGEAIAGKNVEEAERQAKHLANNLRMLDAGKPLKHYKPINTIKYPRAFISLGGDQGVLLTKRLFLKGKFIYRMKKWVEKKYMARFG